LFLPAPPGLSRFNYKVYHTTAPLSIIFTGKNFYFKITILKNTSLTDIF
jgi:hypothetical protein